MSSPLAIATGTVTGQVVNGAGVALAGLPVVAKLNAGLSTPQSIAPAGQIVPIEVVTTTDANGFWSLLLVPNNNINPINTTWTISVPGMPDVVIQLNDTASHAYLSLAVSPTAASLAPAGQTVAALTVTGLLSAQAEADVTGPAKFHGSDPWYDVTHPTWGAKGDGATDDAAAIGSALTAAGATGGIVWLPPATYAIGSRLVVPFGVELRGASRNATIIKALGTFPANTELVRLGDLTGNVGVGCRIRGCLVDCNNIVGSIGVYSERINENSGVYESAVRNHVSRGVQIKQPASGATPQHWTIWDLEVYSGTGTGATAIGVDVAFTTLIAPIREIAKVTVFATGSTQLTTAIKIDGTVAGKLRDIHVENAVNGILIGSIESCFALGVDNVDGLNNVTNLVVISNAVGTQDGLVLTNIHPNGATNAIVDQIAGVTLTAQQALYAIGNGSAAQRTVLSTDATQGARFKVLTVTQSFQPPTPAGAAQAGQVFMGSGVPANANGNNGDVYIRTDTPATANQRIYNKQAGAWVGIL